jgi:hypothetical protein
MLMAMLARMDAMEEAQRRGDAIDIHDVSNEEQEAEVP